MRRDRPRHYTHLSGSLRCRSGWTGRCSGCGRIDKNQRQYSREPTRDCRDLHARSPVPVPALSCRRGLSSTVSLFGIGARVVTNKPRQFGRDAGRRRSDVADDRVCHPVVQRPLAVTEDHERVDQEIDPEGDHVQQPAEQPLMQNSRSAIRPQSNGSPVFASATTARAASLPGSGRPPR